MGDPRCRLNGYKRVTKTPDVLLLEPERPRSLGHRQPRTGCGLGTIPTTVLLPSIPLATAGSGEMQEPASPEDGPCSSMVDREALLPSSTGQPTRLQEDSPQQPDDRGPVDRDPPARPPAAKASRLSDFWEIRPGAGNLSESAKNLVEASWRNSTEKRYGGAWKQWTEWCSLQGIQAATPTLANILNYLASLFDKGAQYRTINLHRSALSLTLGPIEGFCVGQHPVVCRLLKGVYNSRPPRPKLCPTWSVQVVLNTLKDWTPASKLGLSCLTQILHASYPCIGQETCKSYSPFY